MAYDERNFRSTYYEKVGFRSVEEKKSLEILLKDEPLDRGKLKQYCLRFSVPNTYRNLIWKVILGVVGTHKSCHSFIMEQRRIELEDLLHCLKVMKVIHAKAPKDQMFYAAWHLQGGHYRLNMRLSQISAFILIVKSLMNFFDFDDTDVYWLARNFYNNILKFEQDIPKLISCTQSMLEREDKVLYDHLNSKIQVLAKLPMELWFTSGFAEVFAENSLGKIWDKICGGSYKILAYIAVVLLINSKMKLLKCTDVLSVTECIQNVTEEMADMIVNKSIDMWQHQGSPLTVHDKPKP